MEDDFKRMYRYVQYTLNQWNSSKCYKLKIHRATLAKYRVKKLVDLTPTEVCYIYRLYIRLQEHLEEYLSRE